MHSLESDSKSTVGLLTFIKELTKISEMTQEGDPAELLSLIAGKARDLLNADLVTVYEYIPPENKFKMSATQSGDLSDLGAVEEKIFRDDALSAVIASRSAMYVPDVRSDGFRSEDETSQLPDMIFAARGKIASSALIPMMIADNVVGILSVHYRTTQTFPALQQELIALFCNQAAIAIRNNRLYGRLQKSNQELDALQGLMSKLSVETDLDELLKEFLRSISKVMGFDYSVVSLVNRAENLIESRHGIWHGEVDIFPEWIQMSRYSLDHTDIQADIAQKGQTEIISEWDSRFNKAIWDKFHLERLIHIFMPIKIQDEVIGVIEAGHDKEIRKFISQDEQQTLQAFVDQAAIAIQRAAQFQEITRNLEERLGDIRALQDITEQMHEGDLQKVLNLIADRAIGLTGAKYSGVWLVNKTRTALDFGGVAQNTLSKVRPPSIPLSWESENSFGKSVVFSKKSHLSGDVREDENYKPWYSDTISELTVPIIYRDRVIGTINIESPKVNCFTEQHRELLEALAGQAAVAIENARLISRMEIVDSIGRELTSGIRLHEDEILQLIYQRASELMDTRNMYIALYDDQSEMIHFPLMCINGERWEQPSRKFGETGMGKTEWILRNKQPILHKTLKEAKAWYAHPDYSEYIGIQVSSWIGVPVQVGQKVLGVIAAYHPTQEYLYGQDELDVLSAMAGQAAIAIDNARLYYDINQALAEANDDLEALVAFGQEVSAEIHLTEEEILQKLYEHASRLMDTGNMYIALFNNATGIIHFPLMYVGGKKTEPAVRKFGELGIGKTEWIIQSKQPIFHATKADAEAWYAQPGHRTFGEHVLPSWIGVPIQVGERVLGVIATFHPTIENMYTAKDLRILQGIARVTAITLENMRLYREARSEVIATKQLSTLGTAIAALQHRINNTFNIIIPNVTRLKSRVNLGDPTIVEILDIIERNARYTSEIIARIQEPLKEVEISDININAILEAIVLKKRDAWNSVVAAQPVQITFHPDESIPIVRGLSGQIAEVFENLMDNARKSMVNGGEIQVVSEFIEGNILVSVKDTGTGIRREIQDRLFVKPVPARTPGGGAGLGLWLSRLMLRSIGGDIAIQSSNEKGTTMQVSIPANNNKREI